MSQEKPKKSSRTEMTSRGAVNLVITEDMAEKTKTPLTDAQRKRLEELRDKWRNYTPPEVPPPAQDVFGD